jgi:nucleotide-binding universal stress UspA family protein
MPQTENPAVEIRRISWHAMWQSECADEGIMMPFKKVLLPVDYSESCAAMIPHVREMLQHYSADLTLVHAFGPGFSLSPGGHLVTADPAWPERMREEEEARLREFALTNFPGRAIDAFVCLNEPGTMIVNVIRSEQCDLVMLPTHGRGPVRRLLLGSVTAKVLHDVSAAVWTGTREAIDRHAAAATEAPGRPYRSIVCAVDETDEACAVLKAADAFARSWDAKLAVVHVADTIPPNPADIPEIYMKEVVAAAGGRLRERMSQLGIAAPYSVSDAGICGGIRAECIRRNADMLFVGRGHSQQGIARVWSHLYSVVRDSPCPVISI